MDEIFFFFFFLLEELEEEEELLLEVMVGAVMVKEVIARGVLAFVEASVTCMVQLV